MTADKPQKQPDLPPAQPGKSEPPPAPAVRRLSLYLRELEGLPKGEHRTISSKQLGKALGLTDAQVRKDFAYFGQFGHPGVGYQVTELMGRLRHILGTDRTWNALLVGTGKLGQALLTYQGFAKKGFRVVATFDNDPQKIGQQIEGRPDLEIQPIERLGQVVAERGIAIGILAVPADVSQHVADAMVAAGVKGILNFAPISLKVRAGISIASADLTLRLEQLAFGILHQADQD